MMKLILMLFIFSNFSLAITPVDMPANQNFAEIVTGIPFVAGENCLKKHNILRTCHRLNRSIPTSPRDCYQGQERHNSNSTIIKCGAVSDDTTSDPNICSQIKRTFYTNTDICAIPTSTWNANRSCFGLDVQAYRIANCSTGCDNVPKSHVCDWTPVQFNQYKNCSSVKLIAQTVRQVLCPAGLVDVGTDGPPPRISFKGTRDAKRENYLSFVGQVKIVISSVSEGTHPAQFCYQENANCEFINFSDFQRSPDGSQFILYQNAQTTEKTHTLKVRKEYATGVYKNAAVTFTIIPANSSAATSSRSLIWAELIGVELSPILPKTDYTPEQFIHNDSTISLSEYPLYSEVKDVTGRRWKRYPIGNEYVDPPSDPVTGNGGITSTPPANEIDCRNVIVDLCTTQSDGRVPPTLTYNKRFKICGCGELAPAGTENSFGCTTMGESPTPDSHCDPNIYPAHDESSSSNLTMDTPIPTNFSLPAEDGQPIKLHFNNQSLYDSFMTNFQIPRWNNQLEAAENSDNENHNQGGGNTTPTSLAHNSVHYGESPQVAPSCSIENINYVCNRHNKWVAIIRCEGGATPPADVNGNSYGWIPYVLSGQFIYQPEEGNTCNAQGINTSTVYSTEATTTP